ncbi:hypothetical protein GH714_024576 [Hevea brasiliensis]|uniref:RING-type domain-containing protein n=1 Tax=Hevea brasiliensis TaxID=3981 RepID=A0A6A6M193_HEVBR|nr:hypothetical protein GH714_024576 [Hevea brasiliensis]
MGLSSFPSAAEGLLPVLVMNTVLSVALLKNMVRSVFQVMGANWTPQDYEQDPDGCPREHARERRVSITQFKSFTHNNGSGSGVGGSGGESGRTGGATVECCVCLCGYEAEEEVSELSCKHFFHKGCLDKCGHHQYPNCYAHTSFPPLSLPVLVLNSASTVALLNMPSYENRVSSMPKTGFTLPPEAWLKQPLEEPCQPFWCMF